MRVLVCGGRDYMDYNSVYRALDELEVSNGVACVIAGDATGADQFGHIWAVRHGKESKVYKPLWRQLGRKAGPLRNQRMLDEGKPDVVLAFPGGRGTSDMVQRAKRAGVKVLEVRR